MPSEAGSAYSALKTGVLLPTKKAAMKSSANSSGSRAASNQTACWRASSCTPKGSENARISQTTPSMRAAANGSHAQPRADGRLRVSGSGFCKDDSPVNHIFHTEGGAQNADRHNEIVQRRMGDQQGEQAPLQKPCGARSGDEAQKLGGGAPVGRAEDQVPPEKEVDDHQNGECAGVGRPRV